LTVTANDTTGHDDDPASRRVAYLVVGLECDRPAAGSARYSLERIAQVTLGRGEERSATMQEQRGGALLDVRIPAPSMSAEHARLVRAGGEWVVEDLDSRNGTYINGVRVTRGVAGPGDVLTAGRTLFLITGPKVTPAAAAGDLDLERSGARGHATLDPELAVLLDEVARVARSEITILVHGETGTGKDLLARSVHEASGRSGDFVAVNCGGIPATLVESHFFGHVKGAFSGALSNEPGLIRAAHGGTLFLDEVGDLPAASQAALLRVLQEREVMPVGATRSIKVDARIVAATHKPLESMVAQGEFRGDLLARLAGFTAELPPLRERIVDLGVIVAALLRRLVPARAAEVRFTPGAGQALFRHDWPHNTRELEQCLSRALLLAGEGPVDLAHLPAAVRQAEKVPLPTRTGLRERDEKIRRELLDQLARHNGNLANVARAMGKARMQIHRWCRRFGIDPNAYRG
jgi:DNA-binding NtrC family response regulator